MLKAIKSKASITHKFGDTRADGKIFWGCQKKKHGYYETWVTKESFDKYILSQKNGHLKRMKSNDFKMKLREKTKEWKLINKELAASQRSSRRCKIRDFKLDDNDKKMVKEFYWFRNLLNKIHNKIAFHIDHKIALANNGTHHPDNLQLTTALFNLHKAAS